ncbi:hypothetical protein CROQUDRAFT_691172 [Cronartium quercuum f. sp. fusiforme G11]|uniref:Uncharacterized protein n=1 Tax=Cronartium quercuum f. sp. fusiforme G11 TaxID=708437 RepID=A0A9P6NAC3_9BASI|nr:hypothetical protein CROQUDRAFT_691172 [Cronartium quercuum f. sp. fusiforme G11]
MHCMSNMQEYHARRVWRTDKLGEELDKKSQKKISTLISEAMDSTIYHDNEDYFPEEEPPIPNTPMNFTTNSFLPIDPTAMTNKLQLQPNDLTLLQGINDHEDKEDEMIEIEFKDTSNVMLLSEANLLVIRKVIRQCQIPSWMHHPPTNFSSKSHRKLRSADWAVLFTLILPFAMVQLDISKEMLQNWYHLAALSEIVLDYSAMGSSVNKYYAHLVKYRQGLQQLCGDLEATPWELDTTMIRQVCRAANLSINLNSPGLPNCVKVMQDIMKGNKKLASNIGDISELQATDQTTQPLPDKLPDMLGQQSYITLGHYLIGQEQSVPQFSSPYNAQLSISSRVQKLKHKKVCQFILRPNSTTAGIVEYRDIKSGQIEMGRILEIFEHVSSLDKKKDVAATFLSICRFKPLNESDGSRNPFSSMPDLNIFLFYNTVDKLDVGNGIEPDRFEVVPIENFIYHCVAYTYLPCSFGISQSTIGIKSVSRNRAMWTSE